MSGERPSAAFRELLLASQSFPGEYIVKAFGPGTPDASADRFRAEVRACAYEVVGESRARFEERLSRHGRRMCITLVLEVHTVDDILGLYERIHRVPELMLVL